MIKKCVVLNGQIINVGEWDYQKIKVEVSPAEYDDDGNIIKEAVIEEQITNPLPDGAVFVDKEMEYSENRGWYEVGIPQIPSDKERIEILENMILLLMEG